MLETLHRAFSWIYLYRIAVLFFGVPGEVNYVHWSIAWTALFDGLLAAMVQVP